MNTSCATINFIKKENIYIVFETLEGKKQIYREKCLWLKKCLADSFSISNSSTNWRTIFSMDTEPRNFQTL